MRIAHSRFMDKTPVMKGERFDKVVTSAWSFDYNNSILTYGATIFTKKDCKDFWNKKDHREKAVERYTNNPIRVKLNVHTQVHTQVPELSNIAVDWYISMNLVYKFGCFNEKLDVRRIQHEVNIKSDFNIKYPGYNFNYGNVDYLESFDVEQTDTFHWLSTTLAFLTVVAVCVY